MSKISEQIRTEAQAVGRPNWSVVLGNKAYARFLGDDQWLCSLSTVRLRIFLLLVAAALEDK